MAVRWRRRPRPSPQGWGPSSDIDLDVQCRRLTLRALGRSVLGLDLDEQADRIAEPLRVVLKYIADRGVSPIRMPALGADPGPAPRPGGERSPAGRWPPTC